MSSSRAVIAALLGFGLSALVLVIGKAERTRVPKPDEVPVAFWSWRTRAPTDAEVENAFAATNANLLFLRAGQFDVNDGKPVRIRPVTGKFPSARETHLVYNGTRKLLREWEQLDKRAAAASIAEECPTASRFPQPRRLPAR